LDDGRIIPIEDLERALHGSDRKELEALVKAEKDTTFKIHGTFDDAMTQMMGGTPKNPVRMVVRKPRRKSKR
jgi:hypothetical protein